MSSAYKRLWSQVQRLSRFYLELREVKARMARGFYQRVIWTLLLYKIQMKHEVLG